LAPNLPSMALRRFGSAQSTVAGPAAWPVEQQSAPLDSDGETSADATVDLSLLHLRLVGEFGLRCGQEHVTLVASVRQQSFLAYLAVHRAASHARQQLGFLLWRDATEAHARNDLCQLVHQLRRV
jgi:hypothetical protein